MRFKHILFVFCAGILLAGSVGLTADAKSSDEIQEEIDEYEEQLEESESQSGELAEQIDTCQADVAELIVEIEQQNIQMEQYRDDMMLRIKFFYEESLGDSIMDAMIGADSFTDMLNRLDYVQNLYDYDADQLEAFADLITESEEKQEQLTEKTEELEALLDEEEALQAELKQTLADKEEELEEAKKAEEAAAAAARAQEVLAAASGGSYSSSGASSGGQLTRQKGVVYYNGHRETYYSQRVLPGGGLHIPGRHVASDGTIRDENGYICVASSDLAKGTVVETSLGTAKVYDCGCASGTIDIYTDW